MLFPTVNGSNLQRQKLTLPRDFQGKWNILFVAFQQWQQMEVDSWVALVKELESQTEGLFYYELPTIYKMNVFSRTFINEGMRAGIPNPTSRERTITLYIDKAPFRQALEMADEEHIYVLVIEHNGNVLLTLRGALDPDSSELLRQKIHQLALPDKA